MRLVQQFFEKVTTKRTATWIPVEVAQELFEYTIRRNVAVFLHNLPDGKCPEDLSTFLCYLMNEVDEGSFSGECAIGMAMKALQLNRHEQR